MPYSRDGSRRVEAWPVRLIAACCIGLVAAPATTQVDPRVLERLQGTLGAGTAGAGAQVDRAREAAATPQPTVLPGQTSEELELRRQQSRIELDALYVPSPIEREYRERLADPTLRQFGYDLFRVTEGGGGPVTGEIADGYILGPGDELVVTFQGATNESVSARVARDGRLIVGTLPPIRAAGRSLGAVRTAIAAATRQNLLGTDVYVSLGGVRAATVVVGGEVERPGQYQVNALADVATAIARAGGVRRSGSLRSIRVVRGGSTRVVDLYGLLGIGASSSFAIRDGDRIIVPVIGDTVAVTGTVARPGIYELRGGASVGDVVAYAGGAVRPRGYTVSISRIGADGREQLLQPQSTLATVLPGDGLQVIGGSAGGVADRVLLRGHVRNAGPRALSAAATVADLLGSPEELRLGTYLPMAALVRRDPATGLRTYEAVDLRSALDRSRPVQLRSDDRLYVFGAGDIAFINRSPIRRIILGERNPLPQCVSLTEFERLVRDTQSPRFNIITRGTFTVERGGRDVVVSTGDVVNRGTQPLEAEQREGTVQLPEVRDGQQDQSTSANEDLRRLRTEYDADHEECPRVFEELPALLPFLIEHSVGVGGAVRRPGAYPVGGPISAETLIAAADGIVANVGTVTLDVTTGSTGTQNRYELPETDRARAANLVLRAGDDIRVNAMISAYESGAVLLSGEFRSPGLYTIRQGERLSELIARAGGLSPNAYPYGAVFTRRSVREQQQEGFKRTARELNTSLLALAAREDVNGQAIAAAGELIRTLSQTEAVGRMVVEADPRVLARRPDLDPILEGGDAIHMPKTPNFVLALGDVANPGALQFIADKRVGDYLAEAGGEQSTADDGRIFLVLPNGSAQPVRNGFWRRSNAVVPPGSTIIVPKNLDPLRTLSIVRDVATIFGQVATAIASIAILADRNN
jgi:protein involved in polysaccharide export with SLBB domain